MMRIGIMQPYFFPYIGYWQLISAVDKYVIFDDVNYINRGWINRNRILINGQPAYFNLPVRGASQNKKINEVSVNNDEELIEKNLCKLRMAYAKAPYFDEVYAVVSRILRCGRENLGTYNTFLIKEICEFIGIDKDIIVSSGINKKEELKGEEKILDICGINGADTYINAIGGRALYHRDIFKKNGIELWFLRTDEIIYKQFSEVFTPNLSVIDVMMFNSRQKIREMLKLYSLER